MCKQIKVVSVCTSIEYDFYKNFVTNAAFNNQ